MAWSPYNQYNYPQSTPRESDQLVKKKALKERWNPKKKRVAATTVVVCRCCCSFLPFLHRGWENIKTSLVVIACYQNIYIYIYIYWSHYCYHWCHRCCLLSLLDAVSAVAAAVNISVVLVITTIVANAMCTSLSPHGVDKMICSLFGDVIITNDGVMIPSSISFLQPASKMLTELSYSRAPQTRGHYCAIAGSALAWIYRWVVQSIRCDVKVLKERCGRPQLTWTL